MTYFTVEARENLLTEVAKVMVWCLCLAGFVWFMDQAIAEAMVALPIGTFVMLLLGNFNDIYCGVITEEELND